MKLPTPAELQQFIDYIDKSNNDYIHIAVRQIGHNDKLFDDAKENTGNLAKIAGWMMYMKKCLEEQNEMVD